MSRRYITVEEQQTIIERAQERCEYCQCPMNYATDPFVCEHIVPLSRGGETTLENLALACGGCNGHKYNKTEVLDSVTDELVPLFHPRLHIWLEHFGWDKNYTHIVGLTPTGRVTVETLQMNRLGVVNIRQVLRFVGKHPPNVD